MPQPIDPAPHAKGDRRHSARRSGDPAPAPVVETANVPAVIPHAVAGPGDAKPGAEPAPSTFAAQLMGQGGHRRGLRGGPPVLGAARSAYLEAEWSGPADRRPSRGALAKTEV